MKKDDFRVMEVLMHQSHSPMLNDVLGALTPSNQRRMTKHGNAAAAHSGEITSVDALMKHMKGVYTKRKYSYMYSTWINRITA